MRRKIEIDRRCDDLRRRVSSGLSGLLLLVRRGKLRDEDRFIRGSLRR